MWLRVIYTTSHGHSRGPTRLHLCFTGTLVTPSAITSVVKVIPADPPTVALELGLALGPGLELDPTITLVTPSTIVSVVSTVLDPADDELAATVTNVPGNTETDADADADAVPLPAPDTSPVAIAAAEAAETRTEVSPIPIASVVNCPLA